jgi:hypothetical protein
MNRPPESIVQSVRQRLLKISRQRNEDFQFVLMRYAHERLLYRLAQSFHADRFVLKGALLFHAWMNQPYRPTKDMDLLGFGDASPERMRAIFTDICAVDVEPDGLVFDPTQTTISEIREKQDYEGLRIKLAVFLGKATIPMRIDIAFGDAVTPAASNIEFPAMLDMPPAVISSYPRETVVAEKLQAAVYLDFQNSRMKDFFDLLWLARFFDFEGVILVDAIMATFERRKTEVPERMPAFMTEEFINDRFKRSQWQAFIRKISVSEVPANLDTVISNLKKFLHSPLQAAAVNETFKFHWPPGGPWTPQ